MAGERSKGIQDFIAIMIESIFIIYTVGSKNS